MMLIKSHTLDNAGLKPEIWLACIATGEFAVVRELESCFGFRIEEMDLIA